MRRTTARVLSVVTLFCAAVGLAAGEPGIAGAGTNEVQKMVLELIDGSRIIGVPDAGEVALTTPYAKLALRPRHIRSVKIDGDHETATFNMQNGDRLGGIIALSPIRLETVFGRVSIGVEHIRQFDVLLTGSSLPESLRRGLVLHYTFDKDEGGRVTDESGSGHHGRGLPGVTWTSNGRSGGGCRFAGGAARVEVPDSPAFDLAPDQDKTFCVWWRKDGNLQHKFLFAKRTEGNRRLGLAMLTLWDANRYYLPFQTDHWLQTSAELNREGWNHVALVKRGTTWRVFNNGVETQPAQAMGWPMNVDCTVRAPLELGGSQVQPDLGFEGCMDEFMVFDRALSADEVKTLYDGQK